MINDTPIGLGILKYNHWKLECNKILKVQQKKKKLNEIVIILPWKFKKKKRKKQIFTIIFLKMYHDKSRFIMT